MDAFKVSVAMQNLHLCFMRPEAESLYGDVPTYATAEAAGIDLRACFAEESYDLAPGQRVLVPSGVAVQPTISHVAGFVYSRSGLGAKHGIVVAQGVGVIDADYRGEIMIMLLNTSEQPYTITRGERVAQLVFQPILRPEVRICTQLEASSRGSGGFGHTGKK